MADPVPSTAGRSPDRSPLGQPWLHLDTCVSTNDEALRHGRSGAGEGLVVTAGQQSGGRGRLGRRWHSPDSDNLYLSVLLRPPLPPPEAPLLCLCAGLALLTAAQAAIGGAGAATGGRLQLKWPNDLLLVQTASPAAGAQVRKLGGILTELVCVGSRIDFVVVGIGCNVNSRDFPADIPATSLRLLRAGQPPLDVRQLAEKLLAALDHFYRHYLQAGAAPIVEAFAAAAGLGEAHPPICVTTAGQTLRGVPIGLGRGGELLVRTAAGTVEVVHSGDVAMAQAPAASSQAAVAGYHNQGQIL